MISHNTGTASHVSNLRVIVTFFIVRKVKAEVREQPLCRYFNGQTEQIIVRISRIIVDTFFYFKDLYRENSSFAISKSYIRHLQKIFHSHPRFRTGTGSVVDGAERYLRTGSGIHGIQVMNQ